MKWLAAILSIVLLSSIALIAAAQSPGGYDLSWKAVNSGGIMLTTGDYSLGGTMGQADAGKLSGGGYELTGGFWGNIDKVDYVHLPLVNR